jgi:hypothetical protein
MDINFDFPDGHFHYTARAVIFRENRVLMVKDRLGRHAVLCERFPEAIFAEPEFSGDNAAGVAMLAGAAMGMEIPYSKEQ